ncbi:MAG: methionyl-tRNA formyltransferase [Acidobacteriota bacterium]
MVNKIVFLGTPGFAVPTLRALASDSRIEVAAVITQPDRPSGRGQKLTAPPVKLAAQEARLPVYQFRRIRNNPEALAVLQEVQPTACVVVAFGQILPAEFFDAPPFGTLNVHASVLPAYRGAAPIVHAILNGDRQTGVTIMKIDEGMDTGDILSVRWTPIPPDATAGELEMVLAEQGARLLLPTLNDFITGTLQATPQRGEFATYAPRIMKEDGRIDWNRTAFEVHNRIRAMNPWPGAVTSWRDGELKIWRASLALSDGAGAAPGTVIGFEPDGLEVQCGSGTVRLLELQVPNHKRVGARDFINGTRIRPGEILGPSAAD